MPLNHETFEKPENCSIKKPGSKKPCKCPNQNSWKKQWIFWVALYYHKDHPQQSPEKAKSPDILTNGFHRFVHSCSGMSVKIKSLKSNICLTSRLLCAPYLPHILNRKIMIPTKNRRYLKLRIFWSAYRIVVYTYNFLE